MSYAPGKIPRRARRAVRTTRNVVTSPPVVLGKLVPVTVYGDRLAKQVQLVGLAHRLDNGHAIVIEEGYRPGWVTVEYYDQYQHHGGNLAAAPYTSIHCLAVWNHTALDIRQDYPDWCSHNLPKFGLIQVGLSFVRPEPWHFEPEDDMPEWTEHEVYARYLGRGTTAVKRASIVFRLDNGKMVATKDRRHRGGKVSYTGARIVHGVLYLHLLHGGYVKFNNVKAP